MWIIGKSNYKLYEANQKEQIEIVVFTVVMCYHTLPVLLNEILGRGDFIMHLNDNSCEYIENSLFCKMSHDKS